MQNIGKPKSYPLNIHSKIGMIYIRSTGYDIAGKKGAFK